MPLLQERKCQILSNVSQDFFPLKPDILKEHKSQILSNLSQDFFPLKPDILKEHKSQFSLNLSQDITKNRKVRWLYMDVYFFNETRHYPLIKGCQNQCIFKSWDFFSTKTRPCVLIALTLLLCTHRKVKWLYMEVYIFSETRHFPLIIGCQNFTGCCREIIQNVAIKESQRDSNKQTPSLLSTEEHGKDQLQLSKSNNDLIHFICSCGDSRNFR